MSNDNEVIYFNFCRFTRVEGEDVERRIIHIVESVASCNTTIRQMPTLGSLKLSDRQTQCIMEISKKMAEQDGEDALSHYLCREILSLFLFVESI